LASACYPPPVLILESLHVTRVEPADGAYCVDAQTPVVVKFSHPVDEATLSLHTLQLLAPKGAIPASLAYQAPTRTATLTPLQPLLPDLTYRISIATSIRNPDHGHL